MKTAIIGAGGSIIAPIGVMLELSADPMVLLIINPRLSLHFKLTHILCSALPPVKGITVAAVAHTSITVRWIVSSSLSQWLVTFSDIATFQQHSFPRGISTARFQLQYRAQGSSYSSTIYIYTSTQTQYTLSNLQFDQQYNISIRAQMRFHSCYSYIYGEYSNEVSVTTMETGKCIIMFLLILDLSMIGIDCM